MGGVVEWVLCPVLLLLLLLGATSQSILVLAYWH